MISPEEYKLLLIRMGQYKEHKSESTFTGYESELHDFIINECKRRGWWYSHSRMDKPATGTLGSPDFIIAADKGRTLYVECKTKSGKMSSKQLGVGMMLDKQGHVLHVVRCKEEFMVLV